MSALSSHLVVGSAVVLGGEASKMVMAGNGGIKLRFLGGCDEVGRVGILVETPRGTKVLIDYGVALSDDKPAFPEHVKPREISCVVLSHAHLDHSGALPLLYTGAGPHPPLVTTPLTAKLASLLIEDFIRLARYYLPFEEPEARNMFSAVKPIYYGDEIEISSDVRVRLLNAGHIPGSAMVLVETDYGDILYTGDFNLVETQLLSPASLDAVKRKNLAAVIMEGTYANTEHPERRQLEREFVTRVLDVVESGGIVLVPAFAVGRSQEIICVLARYRFPHEVTLDGMAREASKILLEHPEFLRDPEFVRSALLSARWVTSWGDRHRAAKRPGVIVSPAGMLKGGAAIYYLKRIYKDPKNAVFLVSFQIPGTPGRHLLDTKTFVFNNKPEPVLAQVEWFDFSAHCGHSQLLDFASRVPEHAELFVIHGESAALDAFTNELQEVLGREAVRPVVGKEYTVSM